MSESIEILRQELRYAARSIRKTPVASAVVVITLGVGIGLVTTFFSLINTAFYRPLPYPDASRTIALTYYAVPRRPVEELARMTKSLDRITLFQEGSSSLITDAGAEPISVGSIDSSFFPVLNTRPIMGALPSAQAIAMRAPVAVINAKLWRRAFASRPDIIGQSVDIDGVRRQVVAVMPEWFTYRERAEAWIPLGELERPDAFAYSATATLRRGAKPSDVRRELAVVGQRMQQLDRHAYPSPQSTQLTVLEDMVDRGGGRPIVTLMAAIALGGALAVMLVACTNVASLMIARGARRRGEMLIRASLGASRWQLIRQQLIESLLLASAAWATGALLSEWGVHLMLATLPRNASLPYWVQFGIDWRSLVFAAFAALCGVVVFGIWPARAATHLDLSRAMRSSADHGVAGGAAIRSVHTPVILELGLSLALFVGAMISLDTLRSVSAVDRGVSPDGKYWVLLNADPHDTSAEATATYLSAVREHVALAEGRDAVAMIGSFRTLRGDTARQASLLVTDTRQPVDWPAQPMVVSTNYFRVAGMHMLSGRAFDDRDGEQSAPVAIVSKEFARVTWGTDRVVGRTLDVKSAGRRVTVVGVVSDVIESMRRVEGRIVPSRTLYLPERQSLSWGVTFIAQTNASAASVSQAFTRAAAQEGRHVPAFVRSWRELVDGESVLIARMFSSVTATFAAIGLLLAIMGIYGVITFAIEQRTREIGVRVALGATSRDVIRHIMGSGARLIVTGIGLGLAGAIIEGKALAAFLLSSTSSQIVAGLVATVLFAAIALVACYLPARRAALLDPLVALRSE